MWNEIQSSYTKRAKLQSGQSPPQSVVQPHELTGYGIVEILIVVVGNKKTKKGGGGKKKDNYNNLSPFLNWVRDNNPNTDGRDETSPTS